MANLAVKTSFNTNLYLDTNTLGLRILAYFIDLFVMFVYIYLVAKILNQFNLDLEAVYGGDAGRISWGLGSLIGLPIMFYSLISETISGGYTIGKFICKIKVVKINGFQPGFVDFFIRWIFRVVDIYVFILAGVVVGNYLVLVLSFYTAGVVAMIMISRGKKAQRLGDMVAGTTVIRSKLVQNINITILQEVQADYVPKYPQVIKLSDNDARIIKETFELAMKNRDNQLLKDLVNKVCSVINVTRDEDHISFIKRIMKDFNYYTQQN